MAVNEPCEHEWRLMETGYIRTWLTELDEETKTIIATFTGERDWSQLGDGNDCLECRICLETREIPEGWEVEYR